MRRGRYPLRGVPELLPMAVVEHNIRVVPIRSSTPFRPMPGPKALARLLVLYVQTSLPGPTQGIVYSSHVDLLQDLE